MSVYFNTMGQGFLGCTATASRKELSALHVDSVSYGEQCFR